MLVLRAFLSTKRVFVNKPAILKNNITKGTAHVNTVIISINKIIACQNVNKETWIRSPVHVLQNKKTLEMETVILFVKMVFKILVHVPLENLLMLMVFVFLHVKMANGTEMMKLNAHADLGNLSTNMDSVKQHAILNPGIIIQIHAHVHTVKSTPNTGIINLNVGIIPVRNYVTPSMVVQAILLALLVTFMKITTWPANLMKDIILIAFVTGIIWKTQLVFVYQNVTEIETLILQSVHLHTDGTLTELDSLNQHVT